MKKNSTIYTIFDVKQSLSQNSFIYRNQIAYYILSEIERDVFPIWDLSSNLFEDYEAKAEIFSKDFWLLAWKEEVDFALKKLELKIHWLRDDWDVIWKEKIAEISWSFVQIMKVERVILNVLQRMSAIATKTKMIVGKMNKEDILLKPIICATRKTQLWMLDKKAVVVWWWYSHRLNLSDAILIKENHIKRFWISKTLFIAWNNKKQNARFFEVECENEKEALIAAEFFHQKWYAMPQIIMLDNFKVKDISKSINEIRKISPHVFIELSWWINEKNILKFAWLWADIISIWELTHSVKAHDMSLKLK